jgi:hypothetical protein
MKVRFYCDIPSDGVRIGGQHQHFLYAHSTPPSVVSSNFTRVAFDVDMPPHLVLPLHDVVAPADAAKIVEVGDEQS